MLNGVLGLTYMGALLFSIGGMVLLDWHYKLAFFKNTTAAIITLASSVGIFIIWDILGIGLGIFFSGPSAYTTGWFLGPQFPLEELFFLFFLCYFTLCLYRLLERSWRRT